MAAGQSLYITALLTNDPGVVEQTDVEKTNSPPSALTSDT